MALLKDLIDKSLQRRMPEVYLRKPPVFRGRVPELVDR